MAGDTFVNLKLDHALIDPNFGGYKLSLEKIPIYQHTLESPVSVTSLRADQYSFQHMKAFGVYNHLFPDPFSDTVFIIDGRRKVVKIHVPAESSKPVSSSVLAVPPVATNRSCPDVLNPSMHFPVAEWALLADGHGTYHIVHTGHSRIEDDNWQVKFSSTLDNEGTPFTVVHSVYHEPQNTPTIDAVFLTVTKNEEKNEEKNGEKEEKEGEHMETGDHPSRAPTATATPKSAFVTTLNWITIAQGGGGCWGVSRTRKLCSEASPDYVALEADADAILVSSEKPFKFVYDSEKPVEPVKKSEKWVVVEEAAATDAITPPPQYTWNQSMADVSITFTLPPGTAKVDVLYKLSHDRLEVGVKNGSSLLTGNLHASVDPEGSTWTLDPDTRRLTVELCKAEETLWPVVVLGDTRGTMTLDPGQVEAIHQRLAHLTSEQWNPDPELDSVPPFNAQQVEECDIFPDNSVLARIHGDTHLPTHQVDLGGHQHLFTAPALSPPALCLRHDVDGVLWSPCKPSSASSDIAPFTHAATFNALGFVAASKMDRKFGVCAPDASYAALVDCAFRVYVYRRPERITSGEVRNRRSGQQLAAVAKQQLVTLETSDAILGAHATDRHIVLVKANVVYVLKITQEVV